MGQSCLQQGKRRTLQVLNFRRVLSQPHGWRGNLRLGCGAERAPGRPREVPHCIHACTAGQTQMCVSTGHIHCCWGKRALTPPYKHSRVFIGRKVRATPGDGGCPPRALAAWLHLPFKACTPVPLAARLLIILLSSASTLFSQESTRRDFLSTSSVKIGCFAFSFPWIYWSLRHFIIIPCSNLGWSFFLLSVLVIDFIFLNFIKSAV